MMDGDGDGSSSGDVSSTAADEGPRADPELPQPDASPPMDLDLAPENIVAQMLLYDRTMLPHRVLQLDDPNMEEATEAFVVVFGPRDDDDGDRRGDHSDADAGAYDDGYGSFFVLGAVPASGVAIACLPETTVGEGDSGKQCAVCLDEYEAGDALRTMPCAHGFHERCIIEWLRASRLCPLCRFALPPEEDTDTDDEEDDNEREAAGHDDDDDDDGVLEYT